MRTGDSRQLPKRANGPASTNFADDPAAAHAFCLAFGAEMPQKNRPLVENYLYPHNRAVSRRLGATMAPLTNPAEAANPIEAADRAEATAAPIAGLPHRANRLPAGRA